MLVALLAAVVAGVLLAVFLLRPADPGTNLAGETTPPVSPTTTTPSPSPTPTTPTPTTPSPTVTTPPVAVTPSQVYLADLELVGDSDSPSNRGPIEIGGKTYVHSMETGDCFGDEDVWEFDLGNSYERLDALVGVADDAPRDLRVQIEIATESGPALGTRQISLGHTYKVDLSVSGHLRLVLRMIKLSGEYCGGSVVWGDGLLLR